MTGIYKVALGDAEVCAQFPALALGVDERGQEQCWKPQFPRNNPSGAPGAFESRMTLGNT